MKSKLFVPASRPELFAKAMKSAADAISFDLEDAVLEQDKAQARLQLVRFLAELPADAAGKKIIVRINNMGTPHFEDDLAACNTHSVAIINIPKIETAAQMQQFFTSYGRICDQTATADQAILVNIETPLALANAVAIAAVDKRICGLQLGLGDMFEPLGIARYEPAHVGQVLMALRLAAGSAGVAAYDSAYANIRDSDGFRNEARQARALGFLGKTCIHPSQVAIANDVFAPSPEEVRWARKIVESAKTTRHGAYVLDGQMIDVPFISRARMILSQAQDSQV